MRNETSTNVSTFRHYHIPVLKCYCLALLPLMALATSLIEVVSQTQPNKLSLLLTRQQSIQQSNLPRALQGFSAEEACRYGQGTLDSQGICRICINSESCTCVLSPADFGVTCTPDENGSEGFCSTALFQNLPDTYCGHAQCVVQGLQSLCTANVTMIDGLLEGTFECGAGGQCTCNELLWEGNECNTCTGAVEEYDCSNVNGPVKVSNGDAGSDDNQSSSSPTQDLPRNYRTDESVRASIARLSLPDASSMAGVPIGAAIGSSLGGLEEFVPSDYNMIVSENDMKWNNLLDDESDMFSYNFTKADVLVQYGVSHDVRVRGHALIWGRISGTTYPKSLKELVESKNTEDEKKEALRGVLEQHIQTVTQHFGGDVAVWDVVNEHLSSRTEDNIFYTTLGDGYVKESFVLARKFLNDTNTSLTWNEAVGDFSLENAQISLWLDLMTEYKSEGVPIDSIGIQGHSSGKKHNLTELTAFIARVVELGYNVELTEVDAPITLFLEEDDPFQAQADYLAEYASACLQSGGCIGVTFWGITDKYTWIDWIFSGTAPNLPLLIDEEGFRKPAWLSVRDVLEKYGGEIDFVSEEGVSLEDDGSVTEVPEGPNEIDVIEEEGDEMEDESSGVRIATSVLKIASVTLLTFFLSTI